MPIFKVPPWIIVALQEMQAGVKAGDLQIHEYFQATSDKQGSPQDPYCAAFANWCLAQIGLKGCGSAAACDWSNWGIETKPRLGALVEFQWRSGSDAGGHHVGFVLWWDDDFIYCLGGNQGGKVDVQRYAHASVKHLRWPANYQMQPV